MNLNLSIGALVAGQLAAGLALQLLALSFVGIGSESDALVASQTVPLVLGAVLSSCLQNIWQPKLAVTAGNATLWKSTQGEALGQTMLLFGIAVVLLVASAPIWVEALFPGIDKSRQDLIVEMTRIFLLSELLGGSCALMLTAMRSKEAFLIGEIIMLAGLVLAVLGVWIFVPLLGIKAVAYASFVRSGLTCVAMYMISSRPSPAPGRALCRIELWQELAPLLATSSLHKAGPLVDRYWSSHAPAGGMTAFGLAQLVIFAMATIMERAICMPVVPRLARLVGAGDVDRLRDTYRRCVYIVTLATMVFLIGLTSLSPAWSALVGWAFHVSPILAGEIWWMCLLLIGHLYAGAAGSVLVATFYALRDIRTPSLVLSTGFVLSVALKSIGFLVAGLKGLAIATSLYHLLNLFALVLLLERKLAAQVSSNFRAHS